MNLFAAFFERNPIPLIVQLAAAFSLASCGPPSETDDRGLKKDFFNQWVGQKTFSKLVVLNSLSENLTLVSNPARQDQEVLKSVQLTPESLRISHPCRAPNGFEKIGSNFWITCSLSDSFQVFSENGFNFIGQIQTNPLRNPWSLKAGESGKLWMTAWVSDQIASFLPDLENSKSIAQMAPQYFPLTPEQLPLRSHQDSRPKPAGLLVRNNRVRAALSHLRPDSSPGGPGYLATIDEKSGEILGFTASSHANSVNVLAFGPKDLDRFAVLNAGTYDWQKGGYQGDGGIDIYEGSTKLRTVVLLAAPLEMVVSPSGQDLYITDAASPKIFRVDPNTGAQSIAVNLENEDCSTHRPPEAAKYLSALAVDDELIYVAEFSGSCLYIIERSSGTILEKIETGAGPEIIFGK